MQFTNEELELIWMSLLIAGKGRIPNTTIIPDAIEPEYEIKARELSRVIRLSIKTGE